MSVDIRELKAIVDWASLTEGVRELSLKLGDVELFISKNEMSRSAASAPDLAPAPAVPVEVPQPTPPAVSAEPAVSAVTASEGGLSDLVLSAGEVVVKAPMVGTFYASPQPGSPPFVSVGDTVAPDTVTCIVEVMKLMNNVEAGVSGTIVKILVENEAAVEYGQPLMVIKQN